MNVEQEIDSEFVNHWTGLGLDRRLVTETVKSLEGGRIRADDALKFLTCKVQELREQKYSDSDDDEYPDSELDEEKPPKEKQRNTKPQLTINDLLRFLGENEIFARRNEIRHEIEVTGSICEEYDAETLSTSLATILHDKLKTKYVCSEKLIDSQLIVVAGMAKFNPVLDCINSSPRWDNNSRYEEVYRILYLDDSDTLSKTLVYKWLLQTYCLVDNDENNPFGGEGALCIIGPQGIGKTRLADTFGMGFSLLDQHIDFRDKDTIIRTTSAWITELGEGESTLRTDKEKLKSFLTAKTDRYRRPYGRKDITTVRRTSFIMTANC